MQACWFVMMIWVIMVFASAHAAAGPRHEWRVPLKEGGQSGICVYGPHVYLTIHAPITSPLVGKGSRIARTSANIIGQCFDAATGELKWEVQMPGTQAGSVMESWHDSTSLYPVANQDCVIFQNVNGMILACDHSGRELWQRTFQAPPPGIKNTRMFLHGDSLVVALPSETEGIDVGRGAETYRLPFYQLQGIDLKSGKTRWMSKEVQTHATQYSMDTWKGKPVLLSSMINLSHYNLERESRGYLISPEDGTTIHRFKLAACEPHYKHQLIDDEFVVSVHNRKHTHFRFINPQNGEVAREFEFWQPDVYYQWNGSEYTVGEYGDVFDNKKLRGRKSPTFSTLHSFGRFLFFMPTAAPCIGCVDTKTGRTSIIDVPVQIVGGKTRWKVEDIKYSRGILNAEGTLLRGLADIRGPMWGGFGHVNPANPLRHGDSLFWQGGIGVLYRIDIDRKFSGVTPDNISWVGIADEGSDWCFGRPAALNENTVFLRSQRQLVRIVFGENDG